MKAENLMIRKDILKKRKENITKYVDVTPEFKVNLEYISKVSNRNCCNNKGNLYVKSKIISKKSESKYKYNNEKLKVCNIPEKISIKSDIKYFNKNKCSKTDDFLLSNSSKERNDSNNFDDWLKEQCNKIKEDELKDYSGYYLVKYEDGEIVNNFKLNNSLFCLSKVLK